MLTFLTIALSPPQPAYTDTPIQNDALAAEVRAAAGSHNEFVVSDDGSTVYSLFSHLNRFSTRSQASRVGEVVVVRRIDGVDWCLTMSQSAYVRTARNEKHSSMDLVSARSPNSVTIRYTTGNGSFIGEIDMDERGKKPNRVYRAPYIWNVTLDPADKKRVWGFRKVHEKFFLECHEIASGSTRRVSTEALPQGLEHPAYDPITRRVLAIRTRSDVAVYHPRSGSLRLLPIPEAQGRYWMSRGEVYFQGADGLMVASGTRWTSFSKDILLAKSANDKHWLLRRDSRLYLRTHH